MNPRFIFVALLGLASMLAWSYGFSIVFYRLYILAGSPEHPSPLFWFPSVVGLSFLFGALGALPVRFITPQAKSKAVAFFLGAGLLWLFVTTAFFAGSSGLLELLSSYGFWGFVLGALVGLRGGARATQQGVYGSLPTSPE